LLVVGIDQEGGHGYAIDISGATTDEDFALSGLNSPRAYSVLEKRLSQGYDGYIWEYC
jgi:proteasome beta subunit